MEPWQSELSRCVCCPRACGVDRIAGELGFCRTGADFPIGSICVHRGEEPVFGGERGICNVFFTHCNLQCRFCQNHQISRNPSRALEERLSLEEVTRRIAAICEGGVRHLGFVSPSHCVPQMKAIILALRERGLRPVTVMNTNAYDRVRTLRGLEGLIDVYLPDLKFMDGDLAARMGGAADYPKVAARALREMFRQKGSYLYLDDDDLAQSGLIVRHLVLPGQTADSGRCLRFLAEELSPALHLSLMAQYDPTPAVMGDPELGRRLDPAQYAEVVAELERLGFHNGWVQECGSAESYRPDFTDAHPFEGGAGAASRR